MSGEGGIASGSIRLHGRPYLMRASDSVIFQPKVWLRHAKVH
jgi:hypothetical protein